MLNDNLSILSCGNKLQQLEKICSGEHIGIDSSSLKTKLATFLAAYADKVMDTVAPLEQLRDLLTETYISKAMDRLDDPELSSGSVAKMIEEIESMNLYSVGALETILDADKLQTFISINQTDNSTTVHTGNSLNLDSPQSRDKVAKAVQALTKLMNNDDILEGEVVDVDEEDLK